MLTHDDIKQLKAYVTAPGSNGGQNQAASTVRLRVTHSNLRAEFMELRLDMHMTILNLKIKLASHCGTPACDMALKLLDDAGRPLTAGLDDARMLGFYSPYDGCTVHVVDTNPASLSAHGWLEDTSKVAKYVMSEAAYDARDGTYRKYRDERRQDDPEWTAEKELCMRRGVPYQAPAPRDSISDAEHLANEAAAVRVGQRCEVDPGSKRGVVRFVGKVEGLPLGWWVGVQFDEPVGRNDGSVKGKPYFSCPQGYGSFLRPNKVAVGDFPPLDDDVCFSSEDEI